MIELRQGSLADVSASRLGPRSIAVALLASVQLLALCAFASPAAFAGAVSPLPESDYAVRPACPAPAPRRASCLALELQPRTPAAWWSHRHPVGMTRSAPLKASTAQDGAYGLRPEDLRHAYFHGEQPEAPSSAPQTVALVDAYNDYEAAADLKIYSGEFGLPELSACKAGQSSGCFEQVNQRGESSTGALPFPHGEGELIDKVKVCQSGKTEADAQACEEAEEAEGWAVEMSLDIEMTHAICQNCKVLLVEANEPSYEDFYEAEETAVSLGATEVSNSWGGREPKASERSQAEAAFHHPGTVIAASAGDDGYLNWTQAEEAEQAKSECIEYVEKNKGSKKELEECEAIAYNSGADFPASSPDVVAVGGTKLTLLGGVRRSETVWNEDPDPEGGNQGAGGGGCSILFGAQPWQEEVPDWSQVGCGQHRAVADVSADADPYTGVAVYDSVLDPHYEVLYEDGEEKLKPVNTPLGWWPIGGTSAASPIVASMFALAGGSDGVEYPAKTLYSHLGSSALYDVTEGGNGSCDDDYAGSCKGSLSSPLDCGEGKLICNAGPGYDGPTGVGAPNGIAAFEPASEEVGSSKEEGGGADKKEAGGSTGNEPGAEKPAGEKSGATKEAGGGKEPSSGGETQSGTTTGTGSDGGGKEAAGGGASAKSAQAPAPAPRVMLLALTHRALMAMRAATPPADRVTFAFKISAGAKVHAQLAKRVRVKGRWRWSTLPFSVSFSARKGRSSASLRAHRKLLAGLYRLTLSIARGDSRSIVFAVG
jgi:hypothetical protein